MLVSKDCTFLRESVFCRERLIWNWSLILSVFWIWGNWFCSEVEEKVFHCRSILDLININPGLNI